MKGYTLIELLIGLIIIVIAIATVGVSIGAGLANLQPDQVIAQITSNLSEAKRAALNGIADSNKRTFKLENAIKISSKSVLVTTEPISSRSQCSSGCRTNQSVMCVSGQGFCFTPSNSFTFERFSGKTTESHVIYVLSKSRKLAVLINDSGDYEIAELINGEWKSRTDLQKLYAPNQPTRKS